MMAQNKEKTSKNYSFIAKALHWGFVVIFAYGIYKQVDSIDLLEDTSLLRFEIVFATIFVILLATRYFYMQNKQQSSLPENTSKLQKIAAKTVHFSMYISLTIIAISGLIIGILFWFGMKDGLLIDGIIGIHELSVMSSYWLIGIHIVAAIYHRLLKDGVWSSMVPIFKE